MNYKHHQDYVVTFRNKFGKPLHFTCRGITEVHDLIQAFGHQEAIFEGGKTDYWNRDIQHYERQDDLAPEVLWKRQNRFEEPTDEEWYKDNCHML